MRKTLNLFFVQLRNLFWEMKEWLKVIWNFYGNIQFRKCDFVLVIGSIFHDPFRISRQFLQKKGEKNPYQYGETPLTTLSEIIEQCQIRPDDVFYELGAGRGRTSFWLATVLGCKVVAYEQISEFVTRGRQVADRFDISNLTWECSDFLKENLSEATVLYFFGITMSEPETKVLVQRCKSLKSGTKVISVGFPFTDYDHKGNFQVMNRFPAAFPWGKTDVYLQVRS